MSALNIVGQHLIPDADYYAGQIPQSLAAHVQGLDGTTHLLGSGVTLDLTAPPPPVYTQADGVTPLPPISYGEPLTVDIRHVYTGRVGIKNFFEGTGDIAVLSGVKDWGVFKASARALNLFAAGTARGATIPVNSATTDGTPVVCYQKAVSTSQINVTIELAASGKQDGTADQLGRAFSAAGRIPLLLPYAGYFLAAGQLLPLAAKLADAITGHASPWAQTTPINFGLPGTPPSVAAFRLLTSNEAEFAGCTFNADQGVLDKGGNEYKGDEPYVVIAIYGGIQTELEGFAPTVASADLLSRFYAASTGSSALLDDLTDILKIASDVKYRQQALGIEAQIANAGADLSVTAPLKTQLAAVLANISDAALKPPVAPQ